MKKVIWILIPLVIVIFVLSQTGQSNDGYQQEMEAYWEDKHDFYATSAASPFVQKNVEYQNVVTYPAEASFKVMANLTRFTTREIVSIGNSDGSITKYLKFAVVQFKIAGKEQELLILKALGFGHQYLTAFGDETSGISTYGGGRYLDLEIGKSDRIEIDFNKAYNPYCAYFEDFTCPLPPPENLLSVAIEAGEKVYPH